MAKKILVCLLLVICVMGCTRRELTEKDIQRQALDLFHEAIKLEQNGDFAGAETKLRESLDVSIRPVAFVALGRVLALQGNYDEAVIEINKAFEYVKNFELAKDVLEQIKAQRKITSIEGPLSFLSQKEEPAPQKNTESTSPEVAVIPEVQPEDITPPTPTPTPAPPSQEEIRKAESDQKIMEGIQAEQKGDQETAEGLYKQALEIDPTNSLAYYNMGIIYFESGNIEKAYIAYQQAAQLSPDFAKVWNNLGVVQEQRGFSAESLDCYKKAIEINNLPDAIFNLGMLLEKKGRFEEALIYYKKYLAIDPGSEWGIKAAERIKTLNLR